MTKSQKLVLLRFATVGAGALFFEGKWRFRQDVREDAGLAYRMALSMGFSV